MQTLIDVIIMLTGVAFLFAACVLLAAELQTYPLLTLRVTCGLACLALGVILYRYGWKRE